MPRKLSDATATQRAVSLYGLLLTSRKPWSLTQLAEHFQCSKATMLRTLRKVEAHEGINLTKEPRVVDGRKRHWYALEQRPNMALRQSMTISADEMRLLILCRDIAAPFLPSDISKSLEETLGRTAVLLPEGEVQDARHYPWVQPAMLGVIDYAPLRTVLQTILYAIEHRTVCLITYAAAGKPEREHEMAPTNLMSGRQALYLHGWRVSDKGKSEALHPLFLAVHRIKDVALTRRSHQLEPPEYEQGFGIMEGKPFRVRVYIARKAAAYVRERMFGPEQTVEDAPDGEGVILSFIARSEAELLGWVLSFGSKARVLDPDFLARRVREEAQAILQGKS
jgi:predicted DNA-binding transcriptional regulator YafY